MRSISRFLLISLLAAVVMLTTAASLWSYRDATHEVEELFDAELAQMARVLQSLLEAQLKRTRGSPLIESLKYQPYLSQDSSEGGEATRFGHKYENKLAFRVWNEQGDELLSSHSSQAELIFSNEVGFGQEQLEAYSWRSFTLHDSQLKIWIKVAQRSDVREELTGEIVRNTLLPLVLMIPLLALVIGWIVRKGLSPLRRVSRQITSRTADNLAPLDTQGNPIETFVVVEAINELLAKLEEAFERERRFTADAAHELRTPLSAIRIHAQNLQQQLSNEERGPCAQNLQQQLSNEERGPCAQNLQQQLSSEERGPCAQIIEGVDRMTHVVEQLLTLSRLEYRQDRSLETFDLCSLTQRCIAELAPQALDKSQQLELSCDGPFFVDLHPTSIETLCRNLVDNAIRYTPVGGKVHIAVSAGPTAIQLEVSDTGPGIPAAQRERVLERFYRLAGQSEVGSGLGLAIVKEITDQHRAQMSLHDSPLGDTGLCVSILFPIGTT